MVGAGLWFSKISSSSFEIWS